MLKPKTHHYIQTYSFCVNIYHLNRDREKYSATGSFGISSKYSLKSAECIYTCIISIYCCMYEKDGQVQELCKYEFYLSLVEVVNIYLWLVMKIDYKARRWLWAHQKSWKNQRRWFYLRGGGDDHKKEGRGFMDGM